MDREYIAPGIYVARLPRTRGDGPVPGNIPPRFSVAPPHARGWTRIGTSSRAAQEGSPARAGMDPRVTQADRMRMGLPRTRGDGPQDHQNIPVGLLAPPHARGWTECHRMTWRKYKGSPARAGMDPVLIGIILLTKRLPRTRGDGPLEGLVRRRCAEAPPHARGWTPFSGKHGTGRHGSPARAGMDRHPPFLTASIARLPRTRGDGPHPLNS